MIVIAFDLMLLNMLVSILANTYSIFETKSNGLYLSQILSSRHEMTYDPFYGAFLSGMPPLNVISFPFIPLSFYFRYGDMRLMMINKMIMIVQYALFMLIPFMVFVIVSAVLIPFAWLAGIPNKIRKLS